MIVCPLCSKEFKILNNTHLKSHDLNVIEFKKLFPNYEMVSKETSKNLSRKNNINFINYVKKESQKRKSKTIENFILLNKRCKHCEKPILFEKRRYVFCNHSCAASFTLKGRKVFYTEKGLENLRNIGKKHAKNFLIKVENSKKNKKIIVNYCSFCKCSFLVGSNNKNKKTCSKECLRKHQSLNNARQGTYGKCGYYKGVFCGSTWELAFLVFNLDKGRDIKRCELTFKYNLEDGGHTYFPDFIMDNIIYEVKGREYGSLVEKNEAVRKAGYKIVMIKKKEINPIIKSVKESYKVKNLIDLYDKKSASLPAETAS